MGYDRYSIDWNKKTNRWYVCKTLNRNVIEGVEFDNAETAEKVADQLNEAYLLGQQRVKDQFKRRIENLFFGEEDE